MANSSPLRRATMAALPASAFNRSDTARSTRSPQAWPSMSLICWKASRPSTSSATSPPLRFRRGNHRGEPGVKACCGWRARSANHIRPDSGSFRLRAFAPRCRAGSRRTESRRCLASRRSRPRPETPRRSCGGPRTPSPGRRAIAIGRAPPRRSRSRRRSVVAAGADRLERPADHFRGLVAEDRRRAGIPHRDQVVLDRCIPGRRRATSRCAGSGSRRSGPADPGSRFRRARWRSM